MKDKLLFSLWIVVSCMILLIMCTDYFPSHFTFLFSGIGFFGFCIDDIWERRKKPEIHLSAFDRLIQIGHFILCPLNFLAFLSNIINNG